MVSTLDTLASEYRTLTEGCGLVDRAGRGRLALTGADRREFLHGQITQDIEGLEAGGLQELFNMIRRYKLGSDVELHKRTLEMGELSLIGPEARRIAGADALGPGEHDNVRATIGEHDVVLVATDLGVDVFCA